MIGGIKKIKWDDVIVTETSSLDSGQGSPPKYILL